MIRQHSTSLNIFKKNKNNTLYIEKMVHFNAKYKQIDF